MYVERYLTPYEVEHLLKTEKDARRLKRWRQVRQRAKEKANSVTIAVKKEREKQLNILTSHLKAEWQKNKEKHLESVGLIYGKNLQEIGQAHSEVTKEAISKDLMAKKTQIDLSKQLARGQQALNVVREEKLQEELKAKSQSDLRKHVRLLENKRAHQVTARTFAAHENDTSQENKSEDSANVDKIPSDEVTNNLIRVIKASFSKENDAHMAAEIEKVQQKENEKKKLQAKIEQSKKEKHRFLKAMSQLELQKEYNRIVDELEILAKEEEDGPEPDILSHIIHNNSQLKQEQEAVVEELFARLGLSLKDQKLRENSVSTTALSVNSIDIPNGSTISSSVTTETESTPTVHVVVPDFNTTSVDIPNADHVMHSTRDSPSFEKKTSFPLLTATTSNTDSNFYPSGPESSSSSSSSEATQFSGVPVVHTMNGSDDTIIAGHFANQDVASPFSISTLTPLISKTSTSLENDWKNSVLPSSDLLEDDHQRLQDVSQENSSRRKSVIVENDRANDATNSSAVPQIDPYVNHNKPASTGGVPQEETEFVPLSNETKLHLASPQATAVAPMDESVALGGTKDLAEVNRLHSTQKGFKFSQLSKEEFLQKQIKRLLIPDRLIHKLSADLTKSDSGITAGTGILETAEIQEVVRTEPLQKSTFLTTRMSTSPNFIPLSVNVKTDSVMTQNQMSTLPPEIPPLLPLQIKRHRLSTIVEMDTPNDSLKTCWQDSSTCSISQELNQSHHVFKEIFSKHEPGITDEPELTLIGSETSTSLNESQADEECLFNKQPFFVINVKTTDKQILTTKRDTERSPQSPVFSHNLTPSSGQLSSVSLSDNGSIGKMPTISSFESSLYSFAYSQEVKGKTDVHRPSSSKLSSEPSDYEASRFHLRTDYSSNCTVGFGSNLSQTESLLSFLMHERSAELEQSSVHCALCSDDSVCLSNSSESTMGHLLAKQSNDREVHPLASSYFSAFGSNESLVSFLKHEESADNVSCTSTHVSMPSSTNET